MNMIKIKEIVDDYFVNNIPIDMIASKHDVSLHYIIKVIDALIKIRRDV